MAGLTTIAGALKYAPAVAKTLKELGLLDQVVDWIKRAERSNAIVLGVSGAGKTSFVEHMFGKPAKISAEFRTARNTSYIGKLDQKNLHFLDTPGQRAEPFNSERKEGIRRASTMNPLGVINVVSYGYHEGPVDRSEVVTRNKIKFEFLESRRHEELLQLDEWVDFLCGKGGAAKWVLTVVTKADLWWSPKDHEQILGWYERGDYYKKIIAAGPVDHKVLPYCSVFKPFFDLIPMSGYYSDELKISHHNRFVAHLLGNAAKYKKSKGSA